MGSANTLSMLGPSNRHPTWDPCSADLSCVPVRRFELAHDVLLVRVTFTQTTRACRGETASEFPGSLFENASCAWRPVPSDGNDGSPPNQPFACRGFRAWLVTRARDNARSCRALGLGLGRARPVVDDGHDRPHVPGSSARPLRSHAPGLGAPDDGWGEGSRSAQSAFLFVRA